MSDYEEDLDDFPTENTNVTAESMIGAYRSKSTDQWTAGSGITSKIPPLFDGSTSWFKYEELLEDWLDLTVLETSKLGPALKNRLFGVADKYQGVLNREARRAEGGVLYFRDKLSHHFVKGSQSVFLSRFHLFLRARRGNTEMVHWIGKFSLLLKRVKDSWMDMQPLSAMSQYMNDMTRINAERRSGGVWCFLVGGADLRGLLLLGT